MYEYIYYLQIKITLDYWHANNVKKDQKFKEIRKWKMKCKNTNRNIYVLNILEENLTFQKTIFSLVMLWFYVLRF